MRLAPNFVSPPAWAWRALLLLAPIALVIRALVGHHGIGGGDVETIYYPFWDYVGQSLRHGRLPLWDPDLGTGVPVLASLQSQCLYLPATILFTLLPLHVASFVFLFGHLYFAGFGTERLARRLGWSASSATCAGALAAGTPMLLSSLTRPNMLTAAAWLPWTMLAVDRVCRRQRGGIAALAVCMAMSLLCGSPEVTLLGVLGAGGYALWQLTRGNRLAVPLTVAAGLIGAALAAVALLPLVELLHHSSRAADLIGREGAWSFGRWDFGSLFLPFLNIDVPGRTFEEIFFGRYQGLLAVLYLGAPAALLGAVALRRGGRREWLLLLVAVLALLLSAYGTDINPVMQRFHIAWVSWRYAVKFIYPAAFAAALLAARGAEELANDAPTGRAIPILGLLGAALFLGAIIGLQRLGSPLGLSLVWVGAGLLSFATILRKVPRGPWRQWALVALCVVDVGLCSLRISFADASTDCPGLAALAKPWAAAGRVDAISEVPVADRMGVVGLNEPGRRHCLASNILAQDGLPSVRFYGTPAPLGSQALMNRFGAVGDGLLGVTLVLRGHPDEMPGIVPVQAPELAPLWVAELPGTSPRVELRPAARVAEDLDLALGRETLEEARREVLLDREPPPPSAPGEAYQGPDLAQLVADRGEQVQIETASAGERYLVLADLYYPGWTAEVDGQPVPIRIAYGMLRTLRLGPGRHHVLFDYHPKSFRVGLAITSLSVLALALGALVARRRAA